MERLVHAHWGTSADEIRPKTLRFENRGTLITGLLFSGAILGLLGGLVVVFNFWIQPGRLPVLAPLLSIGGPLLLLLMAIRRVRSTGVFLLDGEAQSLKRVDRTEEWSFNDIVRVVTKRDHFERNPASLVHGQARWVVVELRDGTKLRLCKGHPKEVEAVLQRLVDLGLPIDRGGMTRNT